MVGVLVLGLLLASGAAAASVRAAAVRGGLLVGWLRQPARVEVAAAVAEEPRRLRYGGHWVVLTVDRVDRGGRTYRTRERAGLIVPRGEDGRFAVGDRLRLRGLGRGGPVERCAGEAAAGGAPASRDPGAGAAGRRRPADQRVGAERRQEPGARQLAAGTGRAAGRDGPW